MDRAQTQLKRMLYASARFAEIEDYIEDNMDLSEEDRSALWLVAWAQTTRRQERRQAVGDEPLARE
jgi:hypothetical protein